MAILVPTIPHTGTKLLANDILRDYDHNALINTPGPRDKIDDHIYPEKMTRWKDLLEQYPAIVPLRDPISLAVSWERRNKDLGDMCVMWYIPVEVVDRYNPHYLPIDSVNRNEYLDRINRSLGLKLNTDWPIVNSIYNSMDSGFNELSKAGQIQVLRLCKNIRHFTGRFY